MSKAMEDAMHEHMRKYEAVSHVTALLIQVLEYDLTKVDVMGVTRAAIPEPTHRHLMTLIHVVDDIIRDCHLSRPTILTSLDALNKEAFEEVLKCASLPESTDRHTSYSQSQASANVTDHEKSSPGTENMNLPYNGPRHTGRSTSDSSES